MRKASLASKASPLACLVVAFAASLTLSLIRDRRYIDTLPNLVIRYRNRFQIIVQILSSILSTAQVLVVCSLFNFAARIKLFESSTSIGNLSFWSALSVPRFDASLPSSRLLFVTLTLALGTGLGALWTGSLTPLPLTVLRDDGIIYVPVFNSSVRITMAPRQSDGAILTNCAGSSVQDPRGGKYPPLQGCIVINKLGNLIMTASTATNITSPREHPKIDDSTWTYRGRSYGKGSSTKLFNLREKLPDQGFSYQESGYNINASCHKQTNTVFPFEEYYTGGPGQLSLWSSNVVMLDSGNISIPPFYTASSVSDGWNSEPFGYFAWTAFSNNSVHYIATSSQPDSWSDDPNNILCTIEFAPMTFHINVSTVNQSITVTPLENIEDFNQTGNIEDAIISDLDLFARTSSSSVTFTPLFYAIYNNFHAVNMVYNVSNDTAWEISLRDAILEVADDLLTYQGILAVGRNDSESVPQPVQRQFAAIKIGQTGYHFAQLVINIFLCTIYLYEASRTRYWKHLPGFDFLDIKALTLAALGPEMSTERAAITSPSPPPSRRDKKDSTKLVAFYDEKSRPRLRYVSAPRERQRTTLADEHSMLPPKDHGSSRESRDNDFAMEDHESIDLSDTHSRPLLADSGVI